MQNYKFFKGSKVAPGSKLYELLESKETKKAEKLSDFCDKAAECFYKNPEYSALRERYKDVL